MTHDSVVRKVAKNHSDRGDEVCANHCRRGAFPAPPVSYGSRGRAYRPDVWVANKGLLYEMEPYHTLQHSISQVKAFGADPKVRKFIIVITSGTEDGIPRLAGLLERNNVEYDEVVNWRTLFDRYGIWH